MNIKQSLDKLYFLDEQASGGNTWVHAIHPAAKLAIAIFFITAVTSRSKYGLAEVLVLSLLPACITAFSRLPAGYLLSCSLLALPPVAFVGIFNLFMDREILFSIAGLNITGGAMSFFTLLLKGYSCLFMLLVFTVSSGINGLIRALAFFKLPSAFILPVVLVYRYIFVLLGEALMMWQAYSLRTAGKVRGIAVCDWGSFAGGLLLRSFSHSENINRAMLMRGWNGNYTVSEERWKCTPKSILYLTVCSTFILICVIL